MRLKLVKIVGFKSFVDPTRLVLPSELVGIVGPNGCGKSNTLDAVRWVMGESSAKELRGGDMNDVLFNGTDTRKPVSQCSVELIFDNEAGQASGPYANYSEISVKRLHHREEGTSYFLNGQRCRRRDVIELFQGTGLGPRSYALIGQGNISRIIEAKPADMRVYLEEVAGIGPYRSRRKETLARLAKTQENLAQLEVLQEALSDQSYNLERQAEKAKIFSEALARRKYLEQNLYYHQWHKLHTQQELTQKRLREAERNFALTKSAWDEKQKHYLLLRQQLPDLQAEVEQAEFKYHQLDKEHARLSQEGVFAQQQTSQWGTQQQVILSQLEEYTSQEEFLAQQKSNEEEELEALNYQLEDLYLKQENLDTQTLSQEAQVKSAKQKFQQAQNQVAIQQQRFSNTKVEVQQLEQKLEHLLAQQSLLKETSSNDKAAGYLTKLTKVAEKLDVLVKQELVLTEDLTLALQEQKDLTEELSKNLEEVRLLDQAQAAYTAEAKGLKNILASTSKNSSLTPEEVQEYKLTKILDELEVDPAWQTAVEAWLGNWIEGVLTEDLNFNQALDLATSLVGKNPTNLHILDTSLASKIQQPSLIQALAQNIYCLDASTTLEEQLTPLSNGSSPRPVESWLIDKQGNLYNHFCIIKPRSNASAGVLQTRERLTELETELDKLQQAKPNLIEQKDSLQTDLDKAHEKTRELESQVNQLTKEQQGLQYQQEHLSQALAELEEQDARFSQQQNQLVDNLSATQGKLTELKEDLISLEEVLWQLEDEQEATEIEWLQLQNNLNPATQEQERLKSQLERIEQQQGQINQQLKQFGFQEQQLAIQKQQAQKQLDLMQQNLLEAQNFKPEKLQELKEELEEAQAKLQALKTRQSKFVLQIDEAELASQETQNLHHKSEQDLNTSQVQLENTQENILNLQRTITSAGINPHQFPQLNLSEENPEDMEQELKQVRGKIAQLGAVNMNALEEFDEVSSKLKHLSEQITDLTQTVESLEEAIATIDQDSRTKLQDTFTQVNAQFSQLFPQLFNGGEASLSWENLAEDPLEDGVLIMARPPGKRNARIQALSGGEKTLSALAFIFSIFQLKPAPFCILDEVDAPLDDANVIRFSGLVRELSEKVQFIFITHNKTTMTLAKHLIGVTMHELGVSRLVSVDLDAAVDMIGETE